MYLFSSLLSFNMLSYFSYFTSFPSVLFSHPSLSLPFFISPQTNLQLLSYLFLSLCYPMGIQTSLATPSILFQLWIKIYIDPFSTFVSPCGIFFISLIPPEVLMFYRCGGDCNIVVVVVLEFTTFIFVFLLSSTF